MKFFLYQDWKIKIFQRNEIMISEIITAANFSTIFNLGLFFNLPGLGLNGASGKEARAGSLFWNRLISFWVLRNGVGVVVPCVVFSGSSVVRNAFVRKGSWKSRPGNWFGNGFEAKSGGRRFSSLPMSGNEPGLSGISDLWATTEVKARTVKRIGEQSHRTL